MLLSKFWYVDESRYLDSIINSDPHLIQYTNIFIFKQLITPNKYYIVTTFTQSLKLYLNHARLFVSTFQFTNIVSSHMFMISCWNGNRTSNSYLLDWSFVVSKNRDWHVKIDKYRNWFLTHDQMNLHNRKILLI